MTSTMRALALESFDGPPAVTDVPVPLPGPGETLVRVAAASVNAYDVFVAMGAMKDYVPYEFPTVLGSDLAGVVEATGAGVDDIAVGDRVFGMMGTKRVMDGSFGPYAVPAPGQLARIPDGVDDHQAGSLGVAGTTAAAAVDALGLREGSTVLIVGATGGVGTFAVQLARRAGAHVIATAKPGDEALLTDLGAAETVDYTGDLVAAVRAAHADGVDGLIDLVNRDHGAFAEMTGLVRDGGTASSAVGGAGEERTIGGVSVVNVSGEAARLASVADLAAEGALRAAITVTYPLEDAARALEEFTSGHTLGKHLITMR